MKNAKKRKNLIYGLIMWVFSLLVLIPLAMVIFTSLKEKREATSINLTLPRSWMWSNYAEVFQKSDILRYFFNSIFISVIATVLVLVTASLLSYAIVRRDTPGCRLLDKLLTFGIIAPFAAMPSMQLLQMIGIYGSKVGLILIYAALYLPFSAMMITSYIKGIPRDLDEAAAFCQADAWGCAPEGLAPCGRATHIFTHLEWHMTGWRVRCGAAPDRFIWTTAPERAARYPVPTAFRAYKEQL